MEKISIVLPVYNGQYTIERAIESVLGQSYSNWELIIVDDGSTDDTKAICTKYLKEPRIKYVCIKNNGVSNARNIGIEEATGKYVMFIDSDDAYDKLALEKMIMNIGEHELICCSYKMIFNNKEEKRGPELKENISTMENDKIINYLHKNKALKMLWNKMFVLDIIKKHHLKLDLQFQYGEDYLFIIDYMEKINRIKIIEDTLYYYSIHGTGLSTKYNEEALNNRIYTLKHHEDMYKKKNYPINYLLQQYIISFYAEIVNYYIKNNTIDYRKKIDIIKRYLEQEEIRKRVNEKIEAPIKIKVMQYFIKHRSIHCIFIVTSIIKIQKSKEKFYQHRRS